MAHVHVASSAETHLPEGQISYEWQQAGVGEYFLDSLYANIDALALSAGIHSRPDGRLHRSLADLFPFAICDEPKGEVATVVAVLDCRQDPACITQSVG